VSAAAVVGLVVGLVAIIGALARALLWWHGHVTATAHRHADEAAHREYVRTTLGAHSSRFDVLDEKVDGLSERIAHVEGVQDAHSASKAPPNGLAVVR
jgi:hypothetical protein